MKGQQMKKEETKHWEQAQRTDFHEFDGVENDRTGAVGVKRREG